MLKLPSIKHGAADDVGASYRMESIPSEESLSRSRPSVTIVGWQELAAELARTSSLPKFRSAALYCEVKLLEALRQYSEADVKRPDRYRVAICTNLLSELSDISGAFNRVLARIRDEIVLAIYSDYYTAKYNGNSDHASENNNGVIVEQTPYFIVVENLENEINDMKEERSEWIEKFKAREEDIESIEVRVEALVKKLEAQKGKNNDLKQQLKMTQDQLSEANQELANQKKENDRLRMDLSHEQEEIERIRSSNSNKMANFVKDMEAMKARLKRAEVERQLAGAAAEMAMHASHDMIPKNEHEAALVQIEKLKEQLEDNKEESTQERRAEFEETTPEDGRAVDEEAVNELERPLTPRPTWEDLDCKELVSGSTAETVSRMDTTISNYKSAIEVYKKAIDTQPIEEERNLQLSLLEPEPDVAAQPLEFQSLLSQFDHGPDSRAHEGVLPIETFGTGPEVPRYLRYSGRIASKQMQKRDLEYLVQEIWAAKSLFDSQRRNLTQLSEFLYFFLKDRYGSQKDISTIGYNMQLMLQAHAYDADVELFLKVLNGEVSEEIRFDRERMVSSLYNVFKASDKNHTGKLPKSLVMRLLKKFFPNKAVISLKELLDTLEESEELSEGEDEAEMIVYGPMFESDSSMNDAPFLEAVKDQHLAEVNEYVSGLEATLFALEDEAVEKLSQKTDIDDNSQGSAMESIPKIDLHSIRKSIETFDPKKDKHEIDVYMIRGARLGSLSDLVSINSAENEHKDMNKIEIGLFFMRLNTGLIKPHMNYNPNVINELKNDDSFVNKDTVLSGGGLPDVA